MAEWALTGATLRLEARSLYAAVFEYTGYGALRQGDRVGARLYRYLVLGPIIGTVSLQDDLCGIH